MQFAYLTLVYTTMYFWALLNNFVNFLLILSGHEMVRENEFAPTIHDLLKRLSSTLKDV